MTETDYFSYTFNEDVWSIYLIPDDDNVIADEDAAAKTCTEEKELYFRKGSLNLQTVTHELFHVYFSYCYLNDTTEMTLSDIEEVAAELFADKGEKMISRAKEILEKLERMKEAEENEQT